MNFALTLAGNLASMMLIVMIGFLMVRIRLLKQSDSKALSIIIVYILQPCLIINAFQIELTQERLSGFLASLVFSGLVYLFWIPLARLFRRLLKLDGIDEATLVYSNVGNLILPLVQLILGNEMVFYASAIQIPFNIFIWTHGASAIRQERHIDFRKMFLNPNMAAVIFGLICMFSGFRIPSIPLTTIDSLSKMTGPTSMLVIGMVIADANLKKIFVTKKAWLIIAGRLLVFPLLSLAVLWASGFLNRNPVYVPMLQVCYMALAAPPASMISQLAVVYDKSPVEASCYNLLGVILCILTMPFVIALYQYAFV